MLPKGELTVHGSASGLWAASEYIRGDAPGVQSVVNLAADSEGSYLLERVGPAELLAFEKKQKDKVELAILRGVLNANNRA